MFSWAMTYQLRVARTSGEGEDHDRKGVVSTVCWFVAIHAFNTECPCTDMAALMTVLAAKWHVTIDVWSTTTRMVAI